ncbi:MAG: restriction endonuclease subunit S [Thiotrichaceae bacterium]|nr:restriction endonuclease subunit S [Thiotrichaceae bacterium]
MNMPKLRFKDDSGLDFPEWDEKVLGDIAEIRGGGTPDTTITEYWNGAIQWFTPTELKTKYVSKSVRTITEMGLKNSSAKMLPVGTVLFSSRATVGDASIALNECATNQGFQSFIVHKEHVNQFLYYWILNNKQAFIEKASGSTFLEISKKQIEKLKIYVASFPEQTKIANFLTAIDDKIAELTKKVALLQRYKKGAMQQIFSQQLRFKDDDGQDFPEWEEKTLGEIANLKRGASPRPIADQKWFSDSSIIGWVRISDVSRSHKYLNHTEQYLSEEGISKSRFVKKGSIIMSICATIGKPIYTNFEVCIHDGFIVFEELQINPEFLYYYLLLIEKNWHQYGQPGSQVNLNTDIVSKEFIYVPIEKEQTKIANFLSALDEQINTSQQQLSLSKQYKQSLLQQMFV